MAQFPEEQTRSGEFKRQEDAFRDWVRRDGSTAYAPERGRYHLYVSFACPWAHRTIILRKLKGLESAIGMTVVDPVRDERAKWHFATTKGQCRVLVNGSRPEPKLPGNGPELPRPRDRAGALGHEDEKDHQQFR